MWTVAAASDWGVARLGDLGKHVCSDNRSTKPIFERVSSFSLPPKTITHWSKKSPIEKIKLVKDGTNCVGVIHEAKTNTLSIFG